ncbi:MAG: cysteine desulfurase [Betaproteobacteria bacterium]|nr:cysteine desulfurase [Betaproteobacteria bacterium]
MFAPIYFDHNATTPVDERVVEAMLPYFSARYGNASSRHEYGRAALAALEKAREQVAAATGAHPTEIIFTSGGSEANNLFLKGAGATFRGAVTSGRAETVAVGATEHLSVLNAARQLRAQGWQLTQLPVDAEGQIHLADVEAAAEEKPRRWSVMLANNETGVIHDVAAIAACVREIAPDGGWFHTDAVQALGRMPIDFRVLNNAGVHALTISSHKICGPKGAAALVMDKRLDLATQIAGGGQERGLRSGTENIAAIVGFGAACELAVSRLAERARAQEALRERLEARLREMGASIFAAGAPRLPNTSFFAFPSVDGETLVGKLDRAGFAIASGSACSSADSSPSHVLLAMGVPADLAQCAVRVSLGEKTRAAEIEGFLLALQETTTKLSRLAAYTRL